MKRIIDLSHPIRGGMPVFPDDPQVKFRPAHTIVQSGYSVTEITMGSHTGTHVDVPRHCLFSDRSVDAIPLDALVGWAEVLDLTERQIGAEITAADLDEFADRVRDGSRVLIRTGWSKRFGQPDFFTDYPGVSAGAAAWLTGRKVRLVGIEQPSFDIGSHTDVHKALLSSGMVLIELLANLEQLTQERVYLIALPLNLVGMDGSPMRVVAMEGVEVIE
ncbi:MAG: cyclase family protein [Armatimonadetes bacterium]|nr:cyclase family protein [Armatimonadota bacterium]